MPDSLRQRKSWKFTRAVSYWQLWRGSFAVTFFTNRPRALYVVAGRHTLRLHGPGYKRHE